MRPFVFSRIIILFCLLISVNSFAQKTLVVLGDSLSEGYGVSKESAYPALLERKLNPAGKKAWKVVNAGVSGSTTASAVPRIKWIMKSKPEVILIALGANDGLRGIPVKESERNLEEAIEFAKKEKVKIILAGLYMPPNYGVDYTGQFKKMYRSLSQKYSVLLIPFILEKVAGNPKYNLADGIHPNEEGHKIIAENIFEIIKDTL